MLTSIECTTPTVYIKVSYGLWVIMMCQHRFISCNKHTTWVQNVNSMGVCACVEEVNIWELSVLSVQFFCKPTTALRKLKFIKRRKKHKRFFIFLHQLKSSSEPHLFCQELSRSSEFYTFLPRTFPKMVALLAWGQSQGREQCPERKKLIAP